MLPRLTKPSQQPLRLFFGAVFPILASPHQPRSHLAPRHCSPCLPPVFSSQGSDIWGRALPPPSFFFFPPPSHRADLGYAREMLGQRNVLPAPLPSFARAEETPGVILGNGSSLCHRAVASSPPAFLFGQPGSPRSAPGAPAVTPPPLSTDGHSARPRSSRLGQPSPAKKAAQLTP